MVMMITMLMITIVYVVASVVVNYADVDASPPPPKYV